MAVTHESFSGDDENSDETARGSLSSVRWLIVLVAVALHVAALFNAQPLQSANDRSRWCTVWSLVERGTFQIDEIRRQPGWDSIDIIREDGHFYSTKPPLLTVIVAGLTWCVTRVTGWTLLAETHAVTTTVLLIVNLLPFWLSLWLLDGLLARHARTNWSRAFVLSTAAFGTLLTPFLMTLNNHTVAAAGVMLTLFALMRLLSDEVPRGRWFALCGCAVAWTCANELPAAALGLVTLLLAGRRSLQQTVCWYLPAALIPIAALVATNIIATGSWQPTYAGYGSSKYNFVIEGMPSYWMNPQGVDRNLDSPLMYFIHCTVGHHGIWSLSPVFLLAIVGWLMSHRVRDAALQSVLRGGAALTVIVIAFYLTRTQNYNFGGVSCALRWSLWLTPLWLMALLPALDAIANRPVFRSLASLLLAGSVVSAWLPISNPWQQPWLFHRMEDWGWINYREAPAPLPRPLWTWFSSLPEATSDAADSPWVEFESLAPEGHKMRLRLTCRTDTALQTKGLVALDVLRSGTPDLPETHTTLHLDAARFRAGAAPVEFLRWPDSKVTPERQQADLTFVRGLPLKKEYSPGVIRYLKTSLRPDAFRCQRAAAQVLHPVGKDSHAMKYRCDVWLCDDLPFGVAQFEMQVSAPDSGSVLHHARWTVTACHPSPATAASSRPQTEPSKP